MPDQQRHTHRRTHTRPFHISAKRRDSEQPRVINSRNVRFSEGTGGLPADQGGHDTGLIPEPPTGAEQALCGDIALSPRSRREHQRLRQRRHQQLIAGLVVLLLVALLSAGVFWMHRSDTLASAAVKSQNGSKVSSVVATTTVSTESTSLPTPVVASFEGVAIHLSVRLDDLTEVGFHPASNPYAMVLDTTLTPDSATAVRDTKTTGRDKSAQPTGAAEPLIGSYIQMWRIDTGSIPGRTSIDEGAPAGSTTYAPIDGTITAVRKYNYENGCKDFEVHMSFEATELARYEMVMIHEDNVQVAVGDKVVGGVTPIAQVRDLTPFLVNQLAQYTGEAGNHAHVQVNDTWAPSYAERMKYRAAHDYYIN